MEFHIVSSKFKPNKPTPGDAYLYTDNWDDYHFRTSYYLHFVNEARELVEIGPVKIMQKSQQENESQKIQSSTFSKLDETFCSLGQSQTYYEEVANLNKDTRDNLLKSLRDCVFDQTIFEDFKNEQAMQTSLLRSVTESNIRNSFPRAIEGKPQLTPYHFSYKLADNNKTTLDVKVEPFSKPPSNIHVIIGRNGVGKTRLLSGIADAVVGLPGNSALSLDGIVTFTSNVAEDTFFKPNSTPNGEQFSNLVTVAFSAFDELEPTNKVNSNKRYTYIGLKKINKPRELKSLDDIGEDFAKSLKVCLDGARKPRWLNAIKILCSDPVFADLKLEGTYAANRDISEIERTFKTLSSGHRIVLYTITQLVENVEDRTLVLIDEPETHLHPPLLSSFIRAISNLLTERNAVALIATHSPVVLQEVPKSCVTIVNRRGGEIRFRQPDIETFAENVSVLTRAVFELEVQESGFYKLLNDYLKIHNYDETITGFMNQVGSEGKAIALAISEGTKPHD